MGGEAWWIRDANTFLAERKQMDKWELNQQRVEN